MRSYEGYLEERYVKIVRTLAASIREIDSTGLIFADGINTGQAPVMGIADPGSIQSTRGYLPKAISHHTSNRVPKDEFESFNPPTWPMKEDSGRQDVTDEGFKGHKLDREMLDLLSKY